MIFDLSVPLRAGMPTYDGEPGPELTTLKTIEVDGALVSALSQGVHSGTHVDAPNHFIAGAAAVDELAPDLFVGPARVVEIGGTGHVTAANLEAAALPPGVARLILKTGNSAFWADSHFHRDFRALAADAARWVVARGIKLIGIDYLSIDPYDAEPKVAHLELLAAGVAILEGLDLRGVAPGDYQLVCAPIRLVGADGAPARALLIAP